MGSAAIPGTGVGKVGIKLGNEILKKQIGRKIAGEIGAGAVVGGITGGLFGTGEALIEDKNPALNAATGTAGGIVGGTILGGISAYAEKFMRGKLLKKYGNPDELFDDIWRQYKKDMKKYYQDYIQKISINKNGKINFSGKGIQEQMAHNLKVGQNYPDLITDILNAEKLPNAQNTKPIQKPFVSHYEVYKGKLGYHHIEVLKNGERNYYITKDTLSGTRRNPPGSKKSAIDTKVNTPPQAHNPVKNEVYPQRALDKSDEIINDFSENVNPYETNYTLKGKIEKNIFRKHNDNITGGAAPIKETSPSMLFDSMIRSTAREQRNSYTSNKEDIFEKHLRLKAEERIRKYKNYKNPQTGDDKIYTQEDIDNMTRGEYTHHEKAIQAQKHYIGIPTHKELENVAKTHGGIVHVSAYTRSDGTHVTSYWRSKPC